MAVTMSSAEPSASCGPGGEGGASSKGGLSGGSRLGLGLALVEGESGVGGLLGVLGTDGELGLGGLLGLSGANGAGGAFGACGPGGPGAGGGCLGCSGANAAACALPLVYMKRLGVSGNMCLVGRTSGVALFTMKCFTCAGLASGLADKYMATRPATWGTAMEVPDAHVYAESFSDSHLPWPPVCHLSCINMLRSGTAVIMRGCSSLLYLLQTYRRSARKLHDLQVSLHIAQLVPAVCCIDKDGMMA